MSNSISRNLDVRVATRVFGRKVVYSSVEDTYAMTIGQGSEIALLPLFTSDPTWEDDIVVSILIERLANIDIKAETDGYHVRFITVSDEAREIDWYCADTEQEAICKAAVAFRERFPLNSVVL